MAARNSTDSARARRRRAQKAVVSGGALVGSLAGPLLTAGPAHAAVFIVNSLADDGSDGTLRKEIQDANNTPGADTITFAGAALTGTIELNPGQLEITESLTITGPGSSALTVDANGANRVFYVFPAAEILQSVTITGLKITGGDGDGDNGGGLYSADTNLTLADVVITGNLNSAGGGVSFDAPGSFSISDSVVSGNTADGNGGGGLSLSSGGGAVTIARTVISGNTAEGGGGGLYLDPRGGAAVLVVDSTISGNSSGDVGGGLYIGEVEASVTIERTTISGNTAEDDGGGMTFEYFEGAVHIIDSTISGNSSGGDGGGLYTHGVGDDGELVVEHSTIVNNNAYYEGGGVYVDNGTMLLIDTIVADNAAGYGGPDLSGEFDAQFSLIEDTSDATINNLGGNITGVAPILGPLADNGGLTQTHLPSPASPALNAGDPAFVPPPTVDQRGRPRVAAGRIDIGAVERQTTGSLPGVVLSSTSWTLRDVLSAGPPTIGPFTYGTTPLVPIMGDWDGDGVSTPGVVKSGVFLLNNQNDNSDPEITFTFGDARGFPVVGDWDGNGKDEVAVFRAGVWQERSDTNAVPASTPTYNFGPVASWPAVWPVAGDWNGDGIDGIGTYVPATGIWNLRNTSDTGPASIGPFAYTAGTGTPRPGIVGDWDGDGDDTVGVRNGTTWYLNNQNDGSMAEVIFAFGGPTPLQEFPVVWGTP